MNCLWLTKEDFQKIEIWQNYEAKGHFGYRWPNLTTKVLYMKSCVFSKESTCHWSYLAEIGGNWTKMDFRAFIYHSELSFVISGFNSPSLPHLFLLIWINILILSIIREIPGSKIGYSNSKTVRSISLF